MWPQSLPRADKPMVYSEAPPEHLRHVPDLSEHPQSRVEIPTLTLASFMLSDPLTSLQSSTSTNPEGLCTPCLPSLFLGATGAEAAALCRTSVCSAQEGRGAQPPSTACSSEHYPTVKGPSAAGQGWDWAAVGSAGPANPIRRGPGSCGGINLLSPRK